MEINVRFITTLFARRGLAGVAAAYRGTRSRLSWSNTEVWATVPVGTVGGYMASAGSGGVYVTNDAGDRQVASFEVTFGNGEHRWPGHGTTFAIHDNAPACPGTLGGRIRAAAATWNAADAAFEFTEDGTSDDDTAGYDHQNELVWGTLDLGVLAGTYMWSSGSTMVEADTVLNSRYAWCEEGGGNYDTQTIALHELGHWLVLRDLYGSADWSKVMYGYNDGGHVRSLQPEDADGIRWIYGTEAGTWSLTVDASDTDGDAVLVNVSPADRNGEGDGTTPFTRTFEHGTTITLTAANGVAGRVFSHWERDGVPFSPARAAHAIVADGPRRYVAVYVPGTVCYRDRDGDGFGDPNDTVVVAGSACASGYVDIGLDNCPATPNPDQADYDRDDIGNACETGALLADVDNTGHVDGLDLARLAHGFGARTGEPAYDARGDLDRNGVIDGSDLSLMAPVFGRSAN